MNTNTYYCSLCNNGFYVQPNKTNCLSTCPPTTYINPATSNNSCLACATPLPGCINCANVTTCTLCNTTTFL